MRRDASAKIASGVAACILSPVLLLFLGGAAESGMLDMSEDLAAGIGMMAVLLIVAGAVASFLIFGREMGKYEYLEKEIFELSYGIEGMVREKSEAYAPVFTVKISCGIALCIFGFIPLMLVDGLWGTEMAEIGSFIFLLICAAAGVWLFVSAGIIQGSFRQLLQEGVSVQQAGERSGFSDNSHFIRTFGHLTGLTPGRYAKEYQSSDQILLQGTGKRS